MDYSGDIEHKRVHTLFVLFMIVLAIVCSWLLVWAFTRGAVVKHHADRGPVKGCITVLVPNDDTGLLEEKPCKLYTAEQLQQMAAEPQYDAPYHVRDARGAPGLRR